VNSKENMKLQQALLIKLTILISDHHYNCHRLPLFTVQRLSDCHCMLR